MGEDGFSSDSSLPYQRHLASAAAAWPDTLRRSGPVQRAQGHSTRHRSAHDATLAMGAPGRARWPRDAALLFVAARRHLDDGGVEESWLDEPGQVVVARQDRANTDHPPEGLESRPGYVPQSRTTDGKGRPCPCTP